MSEGENKGTKQINPYDMIEGDLTLYNDDEELMRTKKAEMTFTNVLEEVVTNKYVVASMDII